LNQAALLGALKQERQNRCRDSEEAAKALSQGEKILIGGLVFEGGAKDVFRLLAGWTAPRG
jgi:hypothetical protein